MPKDFVMRGQTASGETEVLNFGGHKRGYAYRMTEFALYPSTSVQGANDELVGSVTAGKSAVDPANPNFNDEGLIATTLFKIYSSTAYAPNGLSVINSKYPITQNLILKVQNADSGTPVNWQCKFEAFKMNKAEEAVTNYRQFKVFD